MFVIGKYVKVRSKNRGSPCYFLSSRVQKIKNITQTEQKITVFVYILGFFFYGVSDLLNKYMINFVFDSFFEQDYLLNLIILGVYEKR